MSCLDVGCGGGDVTFELARRVQPGGRVTGIDIDVVQLDLARQAALAQGMSNVELRAMNVYEWAEPDTYDLVYCRNFLQHLSRPVDVLRCMWSAVRYGGAVVVEDADFEGSFCDPPNDGFDFWVEGVALDPEVQASLERANSVVIPTAKVDGVEAAYWCRMPERNHLRWVLPYDEDLLLDAMCRLHPEGGLSLGATTKYVGSFRAHGLLAPVWDLPSDMEATDLVSPVAELERRLAAALLDQSPLSSEQRRSRGALLGRQLTIR